MYLTHIYLSYFYKDNYYHNENTKQFGTSFFILTNIKNYLPSTSHFVYIATWTRKGQQVSNQFVTLLKHCIFFVQK